jgi:hypothetical protein
MSDCPHCWETPCCCGHEFPHQISRMDLRALILMKALIEKRIAELQGKQNED